MVDLPPLIPLFLTLTLTLGLLMLAPEHVEHGLYGKQDDGEHEERHHGIDYLIHTHPFGMRGLFRQSIPSPRNLPRRLAAAAPKATGLLTRDSRRDALPGVPRYGELLLFSSPRAFRSLS